MSAYNANNVPPPYDAERRIYNSGGAGGTAITYYNDRPTNGCCSKMGRVPFLTILGVLLVGAGSALLMLGYKTFAPGLYKTYEALSFDTTMRTEWSESMADFIQKEADKGEDSYYSPKNPNYIIADSILAGAGIVFLLILAILSSGMTREHCCQTRSCCQGYAMFVHFTSGVVVVLLLVFFVMAALTMFIPMMFSLYLDGKCAPDQSTKPCFNSTDFGLSVKEGNTTTVGEICFANDGFCSQLEDMQTGFIYWCSGGFGAALGLVFVLMAHAANFAHFGDMKKSENEEKYVF